MLEFQRQDKLKERDNIREEIQKIKLPIGWVGGGLCVDIGVFCAADSNFWARRDQALPSTHSAVGSTPR